MKRNAFRFAAAALMPVCAAVFILIAFIGAELPASFSVNKGSALTFSNALLSASAVSDDGAAEAAASSHDSYRASVNLFGLFPVGTVTVKTVDEESVSVCGTPFGIKLYTDGVLVVGLSDVDAQGESVSPALKAGVREGDVIIAIGGEAVSDTADVSARITRSDGAPLTLTLRRDGVIFEATFTPRYSVTEERFKAGMWIRDSAAGIGTLTYIDDQTGVFAGLGHPVSDVDTGQVFPLADGEVVPARIYAVTKGDRGVPGALQGGFEYGTLGILKVNDDTGLYGILSNRPLFTEPYPIARKQEVATGDATLITTVDGVEPRAYTVRIDRVGYADAEPTRNMMITVTDEALLAETGGIVQGMSGSPLIQSGKLIGAVTHVLLGDPTRGYAIFAENMQKTAGAVARAEAA